VRSKRVVSVGRIMWFLGQIFGDQMIRNMSQSWYGKEWRQQKEEGLDIPNCGPKTLPVHVSGGFERAEYSF